MMMLPKERKNGEEKLRGYWSNNGVAIAQEDSVWEGKRERSLKQRKRKKKKAKVEGKQWRY